MLALRNNCDSWRSNHHSVVELLLKTPNIDVNKKDKWGFCALREAVDKKNNELLKLLLDLPNIDVNIVSNKGGSAVYWAVEKYSYAALYLLLNHPDLTSHTLNLKMGTLVKKNTPVMLAVKRNAQDCLELLVDDLRVDLDTTDRYGRSLEEMAGLVGLGGIRWDFLEHCCSCIFWVFLPFSSISQGHACAPQNHGRR